MDRMQHWWRPIPAPLCEKLGKCRNGGEAAARSSQCSHGAISSLLFAPATQTGHNGAEAGQSGMLALAALATVHSGRNQGFFGCIGCIYLVKILAQCAILKCTLGESFRWMVQ